MLASTLILITANVVYSVDPNNWNYMLSVTGVYNGLTVCTQNCFKAQPTFALPLTQAVVQNMCTEIIKPLSKVESQLISCTAACKNSDADLRKVKKLPLVCESIITSDQHRKAALLNRDGDNHNDIGTAHTPHTQSLAAPSTSPILNLETTDIFFMTYDLTEKFGALSDCSKHCITDILWKHHVHVEFPLYVSQGQKICLVLDEIKLDLGQCVKPCKPETEAGYLSLLPTVCTQLKKQYGLAAGSSHTTTTTPAAVDPVINLPSSATTPFSKSSLFGIVFLLVVLLF
ncbi:UNVERIFIED_CONTAM: hypothetical protein HDU68_003565 [Siphonaria sp. JEL0065]|nr:hypothetical protein HDU68_003565 [Siphonaria sp. JEL0065]